jgi:hypothetical protein
MLFLSMKITALSGYFHFIGVMGISPIFCSCRRLTALFFLKNNAENQKKVSSENENRCFG